MPVGLVFTDLWYLGVVLGAAVGAALVRSRRRDREQVERELRARPHLRGAREWTPPRPATGTTALLLGAALVASGVALLLVPDLGVDGRPPLGAGLGVLVVGVVVRVRHRRR